MQNKIQQVKTLLDALPYIKEFKKKIIVIKYGGSAQINTHLKDKFAQDVALLYLVGLRPIIVHGGGEKITKMLDKLDIHNEFKDGLRVTSRQSLEVAEMILGGNINKEITTLINHYGGKAIGITGKDANFIKAKPLEDGKYGYVGKITKVDKKVLKNLLKEGFIPIIAPIASGDNDSFSGYNINADLCASKVATAVGAQKIIFLTDTKGILDKDNSLISSLDKKSALRLKESGVITGGMLPKIDACLEALKNGVKSAQIIDGRVEHSILLELFTKSGIGTIITKNKVKLKCL